jgi:cobalt-zinc-cadmium efflux system outer membrane protein
LLRDFFTLVAADLDANGSVDVRARCAGVSMLLRGSRGLLTVASLVIGGAVGGGAATVHAQGPAPGAGPASAPVLTIDQAVRDALDHNPSLSAERYNVTVADAAIRTASLRPNPVLTVNALRTDHTIFANNISPNEGIVRTDVILEGPGKRARRIEQASLAKAVTALLVQDTTRQLVLAVQHAFVDVQVARMNLTLAQENLGTWRNVVQINTDRVRTGDLAAVELDRSRLAALDFENDVREQQTTLQVARSTLNTLLGRDPTGDLVDVAGDLRKDDAAIDYETLRRLAMAQRPDLQAATQDQARSAADVRAQLANGRIDYTVSGEYHRQQAPGISGNVYGVYVSVPLPLFNRNQGEIARARAQQSQAAVRTTAVAAGIANDVTTAFAQYTGARDTVAAIETQMLARARDVRTTTEYSYRRGEASFVELLDAVRAFNDTIQDYNEARANYARSLYDIDAIAGTASPITAHPVNASPVNSRPVNR